MRNRAGRGHLKIEAGDTRTVRTNVSVKVQTSAFRDKEAGCVRIRRVVNQLRSMHGRDGCRTELHSILRIGVQLPTEVYILCGIVDPDITPNWVLMDID